MCLAIPGKVVLTYQEDNLRMGKVDFGGVTKRVCLELTPQVQPGEYVIVHVGFALQAIDENEARAVFTLLESAAGSELDGESGGSDETPV